MATKRTMIWLACSLGVLFFLCAGVCVPTLLRRADRTACASQLGSLARIISLYANDHAGSFPSNLTVLSREYPFTKTLYRCPSCKGGHVEDMTDVDAWSDYKYVYWEEGVKTPSDYPILYDKSLSNHKTGIHIVQVKHVLAEKKGRPDVLWDKNSEWLNDFWENSVSP